MALLTVSLLIGCAVIPEVETAYDPAITTFKIYRTFNWYPTEVPPPPAEAGSLPYSSLLDLRIREAIASELVKQGLNPTTRDPGLLIAYDIAVDTAQLPVSGFTLPPGFGYGYSHWYGYRFNYGLANLPAIRNINEYPVGTLVIDIIDESTRQLIWRGWSYTDLDLTLSEPRKINRIVANIMSRFPPTPELTR
ncbi:DUF4136 domain-containing protein [Pontibacter locisalis]|uniref:DUF4136 domain-containing protein n=1 Tax=Pontibacter locisalis TaxID=1719035 RepID=UPI00366B4D2E